MCDHVAYWCGLIETGMAVGVGPVADPKGGWGVASCEWRMTPRPGYSPRTIRPSDRQLGAVDEILPVPRAVIGRHGRSAPRAGVAAARINRRRVKRRGKGRPQSSTEGHFGWRCPLSVPRRSRVGAIVRQLNLGNLPRSSRQHPDRVACRDASRWKSTYIAFGAA